MNTAQSTTPQTSTEPSVEPSVSPFARGNQDREDAQNSLNRMNKTLGELAGNADKTSPQNVNVLKNIMRAILNFLARVARKLGMKGASDNYQNMSNQVADAQTGKEMGNIAQNAQKQTHDVANDLGRLSDENVKASAQALQSGGIGKFDAAAWALMASNRGENIGDPSRIVPAALNGHADALENLQKELETIEQKIRTLVSQAALVQSSRIDIAATSIGDIVPISQKLDISPAERAELAQLFEEHKLTMQHIAGVKDAAKNMLEIGWKSGMPMDAIHNPIHRLWTDDELEQVLMKFAVAYPEEAKAREAAERRVVLQAQNKQTLKPQGNPADAKEVDLEVRRAGEQSKEFLKDVGLPVLRPAISGSPSPALTSAPSADVENRMEALRLLQAYRARVSGAPNMQALAEADRKNKLTQQTPEMLEAMASLAAQKEQRDIEKSSALVAQAAKHGDASTAIASIQDRLLAASEGASRDVERLEQIEDAEQNGLQPHEIQQMV